LQHLGKERQRTPVVWRVSVGRGKPLTSNHRVFLSEDLDNGIRQMPFGTLDLESRLQEMPARDITIADPNLMVIGREVPTAFENRIEILATNQAANAAIFHRGAR
jgi:hypothetical protein